MSGQTSRSIAVALFLAQEGSDLYANGNHGQAPTGLCTDEVVTLLIKFAETKG